MIYLELESENKGISGQELKEAIFSLLEKLGNKKKVLAIPPDHTRFHSKAGEITRLLNDYYNASLQTILPALGTHSPMTHQQLEFMFGDIPKEKFLVHNWRSDLATLGRVPANFINEVSGSIVNYDWPAQVNKVLIDGGFDMIVSVGQVVPHEVIGMANYNKNIFIGTGGAEGINKSHFLGAAYGMERIMGRAINPVRRVLNYASDKFASNMPILYILTVVSKNEKGNLVLNGLYAGDNEECFLKASKLSLKLNFNLLPEPVKKFVVYLDPSEYKSTWLGNKSIYRTRMAIADKGELIVIAPGLKEFGEDKEIDRLIRKYGYRNTSEVLEMVERNEDLKENLSAAAHLIHGSSEERFKITYCPGNLSETEIKSVGFNYGSLQEMTKLYNPEKMKDGWNFLNEESIYYISNPALGLWAYEGRFNEK